MKSDAMNSAMRNTYLIVKRLSFTTIDNLDLQSMKRSMNKNKQRSDIEILDMTCLSYWRVTLDLS
jgi:hypothetical protein